MINFRRYYSIIVEGIFLTEGGQAADNLVDGLKKATGNSKLKYVRATVTPVVIDELQTLLSLLRKKGFIKETKPSFILGSSRLFAIKAGLKAPEPNEVETPEIINKALVTKTDLVILI